MLVRTGARSTSRHIRLRRLLGNRMLRGAMPLVAILAAASGSARAQDSLARARAMPERILAGVRGLYDFGFHLTRFNVFASSPDCGEFTTGSSARAGFGASFSYSSLFSRRWGLAIAIDGGRETGTLTAQPLEPLVIFDTAKISAPIIDHEYRFNSSWSIVRADLLADYRALDRLSLRGGLWFGLRSGAVLEQTDNIVNEPVYRFKGGVTASEMTKAQVLTATTFAFGATGSVAYQIPFTGRIWLVPELTLRTELTSAMSDIPWRSLTAGLGLSLMYDLTPPEEAPPPPAKPPAEPQGPVAETPPRRMRTRVSMDLYGIDEAGARLPAATIRINEVLYRQRTPLLGPVYFDRGAATLPARYARLTRELARRFAPDSLADLDPLALHYHSLNLLGFRMRQDVSARITLTGYSASGEPSALGRARALGVRQYLSDVWGIDSARIGVAAGARAGGKGEDRRAEGRKVAIASASPAITDPVVLDHIERGFEPPLIALDPTFDSVGLKRWTIVLSYDGKEVGRYSSLDAAGTEGSSIQWQIPDDQADLTHTFLEAELTVEDSTGFEVSSRTQTPLTLERTFRIVERKIPGGDREAVTYSLLAFAYNSAELDRRNNEVLREIAEGVRSGASVRVVGYTDRTGTEEGNQALSLRRAGSAARVLRDLLRERGVRNVEISSKGLGEEESRYNNGLPEGRILSREVDVIVEQRAPRSVPGP